MPNIKITDQLGASIDAKLAPTSTWLQSARDLTAVVLHGASISKLKLLTLSDPAVRSLDPAISFQQPVTLGDGGPVITFQADAGGSFGVVSRTPDSALLFSPDEYGDNIEIPAGSCYLSLGFHGTVGAGIAAGAGALTFGVDVGGGIRVESSRLFPAGATAPSIAEALRVSFSEFLIPTSADDFAALPPDAVVTIAGHGKLKFSGTANLLAVANPLATAALPSPLPSLSIRQGASVTVGASWEIVSEYQVRIRKTNTGAVRLGWYRKHGSEIAVKASATAGLTAGLNDTDLLPAVLGAISSNAAADLAELRQAGLPDAQAQTYADAVAAAVNRKLELSLAAELSSLRAEEAAFLYDIDLAALDDAGKHAIQSALRGELTALADLDTLPAGIAGVHSIFTKSRASRFSLKINLLGIFNYGSVSKLALKGTITSTPSTGELVIADQASATRIASFTTNFGPNEDKLRHLLAESFLITAAYRSSGAVVSPPELSSSHIFFRLDEHADRDDLRRAAAITAALGLGSPALPAGDDFGRTAVFAEARYDDAMSHALFLGASGKPRSRDEYEAAGRRAIRLLVLPDGDDAFRLKPAIDDALWKRMKELGPANFEQVLPKNQADGVRPDYIAIRWWADSMCETGEILARMTRPGAVPLDLRNELANKLRDVAAKAHEQFGSPWGLVAMFLASGSVASAAAQITSPRITFTAEPSVAAGSPPSLPGR